MRFEEQVLDFDFNNYANNQVCLSLNENHKYVSRYQTRAVPQWLNLPFNAIDFNQSRYFNDL